MKQYLQPICEMMMFDSNEDIITASTPVSFTKVDNNTVGIDSITW